MDDYELHRIAPNNPSLTATAAQRAPLHQQTLRGKSKSSKSNSQTSGGSKTVPPKLTKYDVRDLDTSGRFSAC